MDVHALDLDTWSWARIDRVRGPPPRPRADHTACAAGTLLILAGGRGTASRGAPGYFDDVHVLDLLALEWRTPAGHRDEPSGRWPVLPTPLWNHVAVAVEAAAAHKLFVFGGQQAEFDYSGAVHVLDTARMVWTAPGLAGAPACAAPSPREDCGFAYDPRTCQLLLFGGWAHGWVADVWSLDVSRLVGPAYSACAVEPRRCRITGGSRLTIRGAGFPRGQPIRVRFCGARKEAVEVEGAMVGAAAVTCLTPSFEAHGPGEVVVRLAFGDELFTANRISCVYVVNTLASRSVAMGSATLPTGSAGKRLVLFLQTKDSRGGNRTSGGDDVQVEVVGPAGGVLSTSSGGGVAVEDMQDGTYRVTYHVPTAGEYSTSVRVGDSPQACTDEQPEPIRGSPFQMSVLESWSHLAVAGAAPSAKDRIRIWTSPDEAVAYVVPEDAIIGDTDATFALPEVLVLGDDSGEEEGNEPAGGGGGEAGGGAGEGESAAPAEAAETADTEGGAADEAGLEGASTREGEQEGGYGGPEAGGAFQAFKGAHDAELEEDEAAEEADDYYTAEAQAAPSSAPVRKRKKRPPRPKPTEVWLLDVPARAWAGAAAVPAALQAKEVGEAKLKRQLVRLGLPDRLTERIVNDERTVRDWSVPGVRPPVSAADVPTARRNFAVAVVDRRLYVYGGEGLRGETYDDLYRLDMTTRSWSRLYAGMTLPRADGKAGPSAHWRGVFVWPRVVRASVGASGRLDLVQALDVRELEAEEEAEMAAMQANLAERAAAVGRRVREVAAGMQTELEEGDFAQLRMVMGCVSEVRNRSAETDYEIDVLLELCALLGRMGGTEASAAAAAELRELAALWASCKRRLVEVRRTIKGPMERETNRVADEVKAFEGTVEAFRARFQADLVLRYDYVGRNPYEAIDRLDTEQRAMERGARELRELTELFDFPEIMEAIDELTAASRADLVQLKRLWDLAAVVSSQTEAWEQTPWEHFETAPVEAEMRTLQRVLRASPARAKQLAVYTGLERAMANFSAAVPCVADLKSPCMRPRHWEELMASTGTSLALGGSVCLRDLLRLQLHQHVEAVGAVVDRALKEHSMELTVTKLAGTWDHVEFEFAPHASGQLQLMHFREEDAEALEENLLVVHGMMASKFLDTFRVDVTRWSAALADVAEGVALLAEVQRRWVHLEPLFARSAEVQAELPEPTHAFAVANSIFRTTAAEVHATRNVVRACALPGLRARLEMIRERLEGCERALSDLIEAKRRAFPRFYLLPTPMLLKIVSHSRAPRLVATHIGALCEGIAEVRFTADGRDTVAALVSPEGEEVPFCCTGPIRLTGTAEAFLAELIRAVAAELAAQTELALADADARRPAEWLLDHPAQLGLLCCRLHWTRDTGRALEAVAAGARRALVDAAQAQMERLATLAKLLNGELPRLSRRKVMSVVTAQTHFRDAQLALLNAGAHGPDAFSWLAQLRAERRPTEGEIGCAPFYSCIAEVSFRYAFEYLGNGPRLVVTPLTERVFLTCAAAARLGLGLAATGPAATGKKETVRELAHTLGKPALAVCCVPTMDARCMGDFLCGLGSSGVWGCFNSLDRLSPLALSVVSSQLSALVDAVRGRADVFTVDGSPHAVHPEACVPSCTMSPVGLAAPAGGRSPLPESLRALLRPAAMMAPELGAIIETLLVAQGFVKARELAAKVRRFYELIGTLLSEQTHYDWGIRSVRSVLEQAGRARLAEPSQPETGLLMREIRDSGLPKIVNADQSIFMGLLADLFPDTFHSMPRRKSTKFETAVGRVAREAGLQPQEYFVQNVLDLHDLLGARHCIFLVGPPGSSKSAAWRTLAATWTETGKPTTFRDIDPKALAPRELFGYVDPDSREWRDGVLSRTLRELSAADDAHPKWLVLDGDVDDGWLENFKSIMDDSRVLSLPSRERISLPAHMRVLFELGGLEHASPGAVARAGILYIAEQGQWKNYVRSWVATRVNAEPATMSKQVRASRAAKLNSLFDKYLVITLSELANSYRAVVPVSAFAMVQTLCLLLEQLLVPENVGTKDASFFELYFVFAVVWACGSALAVEGGVDYRSNFSRWWIDTWKSVSFPARGDVFDFYVERRKQDFVSWSEQVSAVHFDPAATAVAAITVPTGQTASTSFWVRGLLERGKASMLVGGLGCGKHALATSLLKALPEAGYARACTRLSRLSDSASLKRWIEAPLEKKPGRAGCYGPPGGKRLIYLIEDLNMAALDSFGSSSSLSLVRQHLSYGHIHDVSKPEPKELLDAHYLTAMNPGAGSGHVNPRLQRLFATFAVHFPSDESLTTIYSTILTGHLRAFSAPIQDLGKKLVRAALSLHKSVAATFRKTAAFLNYDFTLSHLSSVFQGVLLSKPEQFANPPKFVQLWLHESERVYSDKLVTHSDVRRYQSLVQEHARRHFADMPSAQLFQLPFLFCHFANGLESSAYDRVFSFADLWGLVTHSLQEYNEAHPAMDLVLFEDALRHVCRIARVLALPGGHGMVVGLGGSGKQSLCRLASHLAGCPLRGVAVSSAYGVDQLRAELRSVCREAGVGGRGVTLLFSGQQMREQDEALLQVLNDLIVSTDLAGLFTPEDLDDIMNDLHPAAKRAGVPEDEGALWDYFARRVGTHAHILLCVSPLADAARRRARRFPNLESRVHVNVVHLWPEEALASVSHKVLQDVDLGDEETKSAIIKFMPFSFAAVNAVSAEYAVNERRYNYVTPKSFLELVGLYRTMLERCRAEAKVQLLRYSKGLEKLEAAFDQVRTLDDEIKSKLERVEQKAMQRDKLGPMVDAERARVLTEGDKALALAVQAEAMREEVEEMQADIAVHDREAAPALEAISRALASINRRDVMDLKALGTPPPGVDDVLAACILLLHDGGRGGRVDTSWRQAQFLMRDPAAFLKALSGFKDKVDKGSVPKKNFSNVQPLLEKETFCAEAVVSPKAAAAPHLCTFVLSIVAYADVHEVVAPMKVTAVQAQRAAKEVEAAHAAALAEKEEAEQLVSELSAQHERVCAEAESAQAEAAGAQSRLVLATKLSGSLTAEAPRWAAVLAELRVRFAALPGNVLLAASFVSYAGAFTKPYRHKLMSSHLAPYVRGEAAEASAGISGSDGADPLDVLTTPADRRLWANQYVFRDRTSMENGAIVAASVRWPLIIDPQAQGITWIKSREASNSLQVAAAADGGLLAMLRGALELGLPMLVEDLSEIVDAMLAPVIGRRLTVRSGGARSVTIAGVHTAVSDDFRLYLQTRMANPHYPPETQSEVALVNFAVTEEGLADQLLTLTVARERPELDKRKAALAAEQFESRSRLAELEDRILHELAELDGSVLDHEELIDSLRQSKAAADEVEAAVRTAEEAEAEVDAGRATYARVAERGALMFSLLNELRLVHSFNQYSLNAFFTVFDHAVAGTRWRARAGDGTGNRLLDLVLESQSAKPQDASLMSQKLNVKTLLKASLTAEQVAARLDKLLGDVTYHVFNFARRGMLEQHKPPLAVRLALRVAQHDGHMPDEQVDFVLRGPRVPRELLPTPWAASYLSGRQWGTVTALCEMRSAPFGDELLDRLEMASEGWRAWMDSAAPEDPSELPEPWGDSLTAFHRLMLLRALRPDRLAVGLTNFVRASLGPEYVTQPAQSMLETFGESSASTPLLFVLCPGVDPGSDIVELGRQLGFTASDGSLVSVAMGEGREALAERAIEDAARDGGWVFLQNLHLLPAWLPRLEELLAKASTSSHDAFRCFLSSAPPPTPLARTVPEGILQGSIKVALQPTAHLRSNLLASMSRFSQASIDASCQPEVFSPLLFSLCFFHVLALGRRQFGPRGYAGPCGILQTDLAAGATVLEWHLQRQDDLDWFDLRRVLVEVVYGSRAADRWDERVLAAYLAQTFHSGVLDTNAGGTLAPGFDCLAEGDFERYEYHVETLPAETAELYRMPPGLQASLLRRQADSLCHELLVLSGGGGADPARGLAGGDALQAARSNPTDKAQSREVRRKEAQVAGAVQDIYERLPNPFRIPEIKNAAGGLTPYTVVIIQELERANRLLAEMSISLSQLHLGLTGGLNASDAMDQLLADVHAGSVPTSWLKVCLQYGAAGSHNRKPLPSWVDDVLLRLKQLQAIVELNMKMPPSLWLGGLWNPMGFVSAVLQVTGRQKGYCLDSIVLLAELTVTWPEDLWSQPGDGAQVHGLHLDGARWDAGRNALTDADASELYPEMPVLLLRGVQPHEVPTIDVYDCPVYATTARGPTFLFSAPLRTEREADAWVLASVAMLMQPDE
jgi:dynein heavy chain